MPPYRTLDSLRITFERHPNGRKLLLDCSRHYGD